MTSARFAGDKEPGLRLAKGDYEATPAELAGASTAACAMWTKAVATGSEVEAALLKLRGAHIARSPEAVAEVERRGERDARRR